MRQHSERKIVHAALAAIVVGVPLATGTPGGDALAQAPTPSTVEEHALAYMQRRAECLAHYRYGSVQLAFPEDAPEYVLSPGDTLTISGTLRNTNAYPLPQGRVLVRILRQDTVVEAAHWYPIVADVELPGDHALPARGTRPLTFSWRIPARAPAGTYRAEFFYLAGGRYVISGIPYVANITGGSVLFRVADGGLPGAATFDRASVRVNGSLFRFRAVPPTYQPGEPIRVELRLHGEGATPVPVEVTTALFSWSDTDQKPPLQQTAEHLTLAPGVPQALTFVMEHPQPGVYEIVFRAAPTDHQVLPSLLKVRVPVAGNVPRIIYSGIGGYTSAGDAVITTCVVNGTIGEGTGTVDTLVTRDNLQIGAIHGDTTSDLSTTNLRLPARYMSGPLAVTAIARDASGVVTDQHRIEYVTELPARNITPGTAKGARVAFGVGVAVAAAVLLVLALRRFRRQPPLP